MNDPNNPTILSKDKYHFEIWNPCNGHSYVFNKREEIINGIFAKSVIYKNEDEGDELYVNYDTNCPIIEIYQVVSHDNI